MVFSWGTLHLCRGEDDIPKPARVKKRWLAAIMTFKRNSLAVGLGFQLRLHSVIPCLRSLPKDVYFKNCTNITTPCRVGHLPL